MASMMNTNIGHREHKGGEPQVQLGDQPDRHPAVDALDLRIVRFGQLGRWRIHGRLCAAVDIDLRQHRGGFFDQALTITAERDHRLQAGIDAGFVHGGISALGRGGKGDTAIHMRQRSGQ